MLEQYPAYLNTAVQAACLLQHEQRKSNLYFLDCAVLLL